jgi:hypothetical protein
MACIKDELQPLQLRYQAEKSQVNEQHRLQNKVGGTPRPLGRSPSIRLPPLLLTFPPPPPPSSGPGAPTEDLRGDARPRHGQGTPFHYPLPPLPVVPLFHFSPVRSLSRSRQVADLKYHALPEIEQRLAQVSAEIEAKRGDASQSGGMSRREGRGGLKDKARGVWRRSLPPPPLPLLRYGAGDGE